MTACGVDGCKAGWFYFAVGDQRTDFGVVDSLESLITRLPHGVTVLVDIPIGLHDNGNVERSCDLAARRALSPHRGSSVFPAPSRAAVYAPDYSAAAQLNRDLLGKGLTKQTWALCPKIREADLLLQRNSDLRGRVREVHPEVCFWGLAGRPMRHNKKTREGFHERMAILAQHWPESSELAARAYWEYGHFEAARDDIIDALVATLCSLKIEECRTLPESPSLDITGLPMEMVYFPGRAS